MLVDYKYIIYYYLPAFYQVFLYSIFRFLHSSSNDGFSPLSIFSQKAQRISNSSLLKSNLRVLRSIVSQSSIGKLLKYTFTPRSKYLFTFSEYRL